MKAINYMIVLLIITFSGVYAQAQQQTGTTVGSMKFFTDEGEKFTLFLNGEQQNQTPAPTVQADNVKEPMIQVRIVFEDATIPPIKKQVMRMGNDAVYMISKNKKGEYGFKVKSATGDMGGGQTAPPAAPPVAAAPVATGPVSATYNGGVISLSDGRTLKVSKIKSNSFSPNPHVIMNNPSGANVTITYDDNQEVYKSEVPFEYQVKDYENNNSYFRLTVDEGGPDKTWHVRLQNGTGYNLKIE